MRAVEGEPTDNASVEVLNFPPSRADRNGNLEGGSSSGSSKSWEFDDLRSAVVFRNWFNVDQQQVCFQRDTRSFSVSSINSSRTGARLPLLPASVSSHHSLC